MSQLFLPDYINGQHMEAKEEISTTSQSDLYEISILKLKLEMQTSVNKRAM